MGSDFILFYFIKYGWLLDGEMDVELDSQWIWSCDVVYCC